MPTLMTPGETAAAMERNLLTKTGRSLEEWLAVLKPQSFSEEKAAATWLKQEQGLGHFQAKLVARAAFGRGWTQEYSRPDALLEGLYSGRKAQWRTLHERVMSLARALGEDVQVSVCKTYVSAYRKRQFVVVRPLATGLEVKLLTGSSRARKEQVLRLSSAHEVNGAFRAQLTGAYRSA